MSNLQQNLVILRLRITSYDSENAISPEFPTINFDGEVGTENWGDPAEDLPVGFVPGVRHVTGSARRWERSLEYGE